MNMKNKVATRSMTITPEVFLQMVREGLRTYQDKRRKQKYDGWLEDTIDMFNQLPELKKTVEYKNLMDRYYYQIRDRREKKIKVVLE